MPIDVTLPADTVYVFEEMDGEFTWDVPLPDWWEPSVQTTTAEVRA